MGQNDMRNISTEPNKWIFDINVIAIDKPDSQDGVILMNRDPGIML